MRKKKKKERKKERKRKPLKFVLDSLETEKIHRNKKLLYVTCPYFKFNNL